LRGELVQACTAGVGHAIQQRAVLIPKMAIAIQQVAYLLQSASRTTAAQQDN